jgi:PEP-CTERM motif
MKRFGKLGFLMAMLMVLAAMPAVANTSSYLVTVTSGLTGTQGLGFALVAGDDLPGNNSVFLSGFNFYGGSGPDVGTDSCIGGCSGNLSSSVSLTEDGSFLSLFTQNFDPHYFSMIVTLTNNAPNDGNPTPTPAEFQMFLCTADFSSCYGSNQVTGALVDVDLTGGSLTFNTYGDGTVGVTVAPVPEPNSIVLLSSGLLGLAGLWRRRSHK